MDKEAIDEIRAWSEFDKERELDQFPTIYEDTNCRVYTNGSGEIFVALKNARCKARITPHMHSITVTAGNGNGSLEPGNVNGLPAFHIHPTAID